MQVHHFEVQGELLRTGKLRALKERVPQTPLPPAVLQSICEEVDTAQRQQALLALLEQVVAIHRAPLTTSLLRLFYSLTTSHPSLTGPYCTHPTVQAVAFLGAVGAEGVAEQPLREYATQVLLLSPAAWKQASTHGVEQHVLLCHLQSLFVALEEGTPDALENVHPKYREPLPAALEERLRTDVRLRRSVLLPVLYEFMTSQLVEGSWPVDANLKQYLTFTDPDLDEAEWYGDAFPDDLMLCHAYTLHAVLAESPEAASS